jgi:hypothetical protein
LSNALNPRNRKRIAGYLALPPHRFHPAFSRRRRSPDLSLHDAIMPLFCPTGQTNFAKSAIHDFVVISAPRLLCMGLFFDFFVLRGHGPLATR